MKHLYAPWRGTYLTEDNPLHQKTDNTACPFCLPDTVDVQTNFILARSEHVLIMLNLYPYNPGHILVIPTQHVDSLEQLPPETRNKLMEAITQSTAILYNTLHADGINIGFNLGGKAAGGTIPEHLHGHVLPRWHGDTNFLPILAQTKQLSADLQEVYQKLKPAFEHLNL